MLEDDLCCHHKLKSVFPENTGLHPAFCHASRFLSTEAPTASHSQISRALCTSASISIHARAPGTACVPSSIALSPLTSMHLSLTLTRQCYAAFTLRRERARGSYDRYAHAV